MLFGAYQPVDVLMLVGNVAPIALYFLVLGLVNSHSRPFMTTSRSDFVSLTTVLVPVMLWPVPGFAGGRLWWPLIVGAAAAAAIFWYLLPRSSSGFVIYNISEGACVRLLDDALRALRLTGRWDSSVWRSDSGELTIHVRKFSVLRNITLNIDVREGVSRPFVKMLGDELHERLKRVAQLPSTMGACLVLLGVGLLILPMWMVSRHIQDLAEAISHFFG